MHYWHLSADTYDVELKYNGNIISPFRVKESRHKEIKDLSVLAIFYCPAYITQFLFFHSRIASWSTWYFQTPTSINLSCSYKWLNYPQIRSKSSDWVTQEQRLTEAIHEQLAISDSPVPYRAFQAEAWMKSSTPGEHGLPPSYRTSLQTCHHSSHLHHSTYDKGQRGMRSPCR